MTIEERVEQLERRIDRYRLALAALVLGICAVILVGATTPDDKVIEADMVIAKGIFARNANGEIAAALGTDDLGNGMLQVYTRAGKELVVARIDTAGDGQLRLYSRHAKDLLVLGAGRDGGGRLGVFGAGGQEQVRLAAGANGGWLNIWNERGDDVVQAYADDYGQGYVGVWDRTGNGRALTPR